MIATVEPRSHTPDRSETLIGAEPRAVHSYTPAVKHVWLNGEVLRAEDAHISPFDRGFLFGDGVYEAVLCFNRIGVGMDLHVRRLQRSLSLAMIEGFDATLLPAICARLLEIEALPDGMVYFQVTRGCESPRRHVPTSRLEPTVFAYAAPVPPLASMAGPQPRACATAFDERWARCSIKSTSLIANVIAALRGAAHGAEEVILHRDGFVTEGTMSTVLAVIDGRVVTPPLTPPEILPGVTRQMLLDLPLDPADAIPIDVRPVSLSELRSASEVMIASSRRLIDAVVRLDGRSVGDGGIGPVASRLFARLREHVSLACAAALHSSA
jgi:D-alanine transaminase